MSDLVVVPASVLTNTLAPRQSNTVVAGEAVTAGQPVYLNSDGKWYRSIASGSALQSGTGGIAIALDSAPGAGQPLTILTYGQLALGATLAIGQVYVVSANVGNIAPYSDLVAGNFPTMLGFAISATYLQLPLCGPISSGVAHF